MVDAIPSRRQYGTPSTYKRPRVSAVRDYPRHCGMLVPILNLRKGREEIANVQSYASCPVLRKYPHSKIRKGVHVIRDFPVKRNAPAALRNQVSDSKGSNSADEMPVICDSKCSNSAYGMPIISNSKGTNSAYGMPMIFDSLGSNSACGMSMADFKQLDVFNATNNYACMDAKQGNVSDVRNSEPSNVPIANVRDIHACIKSKKDDVKVYNSSTVIRNEQCELDVSIANNVFACTDFRDSKPCNVRDIHAWIELKKEDVEESSSLMNVVDISIANNFYACIDVKNSKPSNVPNATNDVDIHPCIEPKNEGVEEPRPLLVIRDEQCQAALSSLDDYQVVLTGREKLASIAKKASLSMVVNDKQRSNALVKVHDFQEAFGDDEECVKATLAEVNNAEVGLSNEFLITNNEFRINRDKVKEVLNLFQEVYNELLREGKQKASIPFKAASVLLKQQKWLNTDKRLGPIPGVEVGDYFDWRAELNIIGLHRHHYNGIDYFKLDGKKLAISVVDSGRYDNVFESNTEEEFPNTLIYSGEGENPKVQSKKSIEDQKLEGGNLALKNSAEAKTPIRVIRKVSFKSGGNVERKYVYDGLYFVDSCRKERASSSKLVFKFLLKRYPGQPKLDWRKLVRKERVCMNDISQGKERIPIRVVNALDDEKPPIFNYVINVTYPESYQPSMIDDGCDCIDGCSDSEDCPCIIKNGGSTYNYEECIMKAKPLVIECGPSCRCFTSCLNRVSQRGIRFPLEVFKTKTKGWGVRSRSFIPCGSFICEYTGEIIQDKEGEQRIGNDEYLFDIGNYHGDHSLWDPNSLISFEGHECFTIDAAQVGNVGRFINHSCTPNLFAQNVLYNHNNKGMPHIMLFAMEDIPPLEELTYHYNYRIGGVCDADGNIKMKTCYCGSSECTGRMY